MYLLDTNIVSVHDPRRSRANPALADWLDRNSARLHLSVMSITELDAGALKLRRQGNLLRANAIEVTVDRILSNYGDRILSMDVATARVVARLSESVYKKPVETPDLIVAATAIRHNLTLLTNNVRDFARLGVLMHDPLTSLPPDV